MPRYVYPAIFHRNDDDGSYTVFIPELPGYVTEGKDLADAIFMAQDALSMWLWMAENEGKPTPAPNPTPEAEVPEFVNLVLADTDAYRKAHDTRLVKITVSIPAWLNAKAEQAGVNFSQILQDALKERLQITD